MVFVRSGMQRATILASFGVLRQFLKPARAPSVGLIVEVANDDISFSRLPMTGGTLVPPRGLTSNYGLHRQSPTRDFSLRRSGPRGPRDVVSTVTGSSRL